MDLSAPITPVAIPMSAWSGISMVVMTMATPSVYPMKVVPRNRSAMAWLGVFSLQVATPFVSQHVASLIERVWRIRVDLHERKMAPTAVEAINWYFVFPIGSATMQPIISPAVIPMATIHDR